MSDKFPGQQLRLDGLDRVEDNNERWIHRMRAQAIRVAVAHEVVSSDDLRRWADERGDQPKHPNAWGAVFRGKWWKPVGYTKSRYTSNHARRITVWAYVPAGESA